jgi:hypothetical protein
VLELLEGRTLKAEITAASRVSLSRARDIALAILEGLNAAHELGIVHRDLKPDNVLLTHAGEVKILDFGLARHTAAQRVASVTHAGGVVGTPAYMSPEQCQGLRVDARTDLYSLGVILFEMASGRLPFTGSYPMELLVKQIKEAPPDLVQVVPGLPASFAAVVRTALAKKPEERFPSAAAFKEALLGVGDLRIRRPGRASARTPARSLSVSAAAPPPDRFSWLRGRRLQGLAASLALAGGAAAAALLVLAPRHRDPPVITTRSAATPSPASSPRALGPPRFSLVEDTIRIENLPPALAVITLHPAGRPDLARTDAVLVQGDGGSARVKVSWGAGKGDISVEAFWLPDRRSGGSHDAGSVHAQHMLRGALVPDLQRRVAELPDLLGDKALRSHFDVLARARAYGAGPAVEGKLAGLVEAGDIGSIGNKQPYAAAVLGALEVLGEERSPRLKKLLEKLELDPGEGVDAWASCVAALRLWELAPKVAARAGPGEDGLKSDPSAGILAAALGSLGPPVDDRQVEGPMSFLKENRFVCEICTGVALMHSQTASDRLATWVDGRFALGPAHMDAVQTWFPLLALGESPARSDIVKRVLDRPWRGRARMASADASRRLGKIGRKLSRPVAVPWLRLFSGADRTRDEHGLRTKLDEIVGRFLDLHRRSASDPACEALITLSVGRFPWSTPTRQLVARIATGQVTGTSPKEAYGWVRRVWAVDALESQVDGQRRDGDPAREVLMQALADPDAPVRWAAACALARADGVVARTLELPGPEARLLRIDARHVWQGTGIQVKRGNRLRLASWGGWWIARQGAGWTDSNGYEIQDEQRLLESARLQDLKPERFPRMSLEARIGRHGFRAGRYRRILAEDSGELIFRPWIPLAGRDDRKEFGGTPPLLWLSAWGKDLSETPWAGMRGFVRVAIEVPGAGP